MSVRARLPDSEEIALVSASRRWSARQLQQAIDAERAALDELPPGPVALLGDRSLGATLRWLAVLQSGRLGVALHPRWPEARRAEVVARTHAVAIGGSEGPLRPTGTGSAPADAPSGGVIMHTSGTTGTPKGVWLSLDNLDASARAHAAHLPWVRGDRWLLSIPTGHIGGLGVLARCVASHHLGGAPAAIAIGTEGRFEARPWVQQVEAIGATHLSVVPTMLHRVVAAGIAAPPCVRVMLVGGAAASGALIGKARQLGWPALRTYGATECSAQAFTERLDVLTQDDARSPDENVGAPLPGVEFRIDAREHLWLRGPTVATRTYPSEPALPRDTHGWLDTGDFARATDEGSVAILARRTELILSGGENVYPAMVEAALAAHEGVAGVVVVGVDDPEWGQRVVACVVWSGGEDVVGLRACADAKLARYEQPAAYLTIDTIPLTPGMKPDRAAARAHAIHTLSSA